MKIVSKCMNQYVRVHKFMNLQTSFIGNKYEIACHKNEIVLYLTCSQRYPVVHRCTIMFIDVIRKDEEDEVQYRQTFYDSRL